MILAKYTICPYCLSLIKVSLIKHTGCKANILKCMKVHLGHQKSVTKSSVIITEPPCSRCKVVWFLSYGILESWQLYPHQFAEPRVLRDLGGLRGQAGLRAVPEGPHEAPLPRGQGGRHRQGMLATGRLRRLSLKVKPQNVPIFWLNLVNLSSFWW